MGSSRDSGLRNHRQRGLRDHGCGSLDGDWSGSLTSGSGSGAGNICGDSRGRIMSVRATSSLGDGHSD